ncbi:MFS transporter [Salinicola sp. DM10]|uniref:MFS transporter n=1 Tax=Salinicola sp. DM10 TaxID=2815721 RepID=UPI001E2A66FD|nr:MFS transporter [Salinicola sp. DM10]MCE3028284.1 MFS transporter [Salinicola sp. DM10]
MFFLNGGLFGTWASRIPRVTELHGLDDAGLGLLLLGLGVGALISFPLAGRAADHFGAARTTRALAIACVLTLGLVAAAPTVWSLALALVLFGGAQGAMDVTMNGWAGEAERALGKPVMASFHALWSLGAGAGAALGYLATHLALPLLWHFLLAGGLIYAITAAVAAVPWPGERRQPPAVKPRRLPLPHGALLWVGVVALCASLGEGAVADWSALFLLDATTASAAQSTLGYAIFSTAMVVTRLIGAGLILRLGTTTATRLAGLSAALGVALAVLCGELYLVLVGFFLMGIGYALVMPLAFSRAANDPELPPGAAIASVATLGYGGMLLGPPLIGFAASVITLHYAFALLGVLSLCIVLRAGALAPPAAERCETT